MADDFSICILLELSLYTAPLPRCGQFMTFRNSGFSFKLHAVTFRMTCQNVYLHKTGRSEHFAYTKHGDISLSVELKISKTVDNTLIKIDEFTRISNNWILGSLVIVQNDELGLTIINCQANASRDRRK